MIRFWSITKNTFVQTIRQPIYGVMIFLMMVLLVLSVPLAGWTMGTSGDYATWDQIMLANVGLGSLLLMGMLTAAFSASAALSREIESRTALTVVAKPVARPTFLLGKFCGVAAAVVLAYYVGGVTYLLTLRHGVVSNASTPIDWPVIVIGLLGFGLALAIAGAGNYMFGWSFISTAVIATAICLTASLAGVSFLDKHWNLDSTFEFTYSAKAIHGMILVAMVMILMAVLVLTAVAIAASTRLGQVMTLLVTLAVLVLGSMAPALQTTLQYALAGGHDTWAIRVAMWIVPDFVLFFPLDYLAEEGSLPGWFLLCLTGYFVCFTGAALALGIALFQNRELASQGTSASMPGAVSLLSGMGRLAGLAAGAFALLLAALLATGAWALSTRAIILVAVLALASPGLWFLWNAFGRGRKWAYWLPLLVAGVLVLRGVVLMVVSEAPSVLAMGMNPAQQLLTTAVSGLVLLALVLPQTRHHFRSA